MGKDTEWNENDTFLEKEVWLTIRYLDPDRPESNGAVVVALLAIVSIVCGVFIVLYVRGL